MWWEHAIVYVAVAGAAAVSVARLFGLRRRKTSCGCGSDRACPVGMGGSNRDDVLRV
jgi:hypothetical protein